MTNGMTDIMVDIEALGEVITQIGACQFNIDNGKIGKGVCINLSVNQQVNKGMKIDYGPVEFWLKQAADHGIPSWMSDRQTVHSTLNDLNVLCEGKRVWGHNYDRVQLYNIYKVFNMTSTWKWYKWNDYGCLCRWSPVKAITDLPKTHNALDDCKSQISKAIQYWKGLRNG